MNCLGWTISCPVPHFTPLPTAQKPEAYIFHVFIFFSCNFSNSLKGPWERNSCMLFYIQVTANTPSWSSECCNAQSLVCVLRIVDTRLCFPRNKHPTHHHWRSLGKARGDGRPALSFSKSRVSGDEGGGEPVITEIETALWCSVIKILTPPPLHIGNRTQGSFRAVSIPLCRGRSGRSQWARTLCLSAERRHCGSIRQICLEALAKQPSDLLTASAKVWPFPRSTQNRILLSKPGSLTCSWHVARTAPLSCLAALMFSSFSSAGSS